MGLFVNIKSVIFLGTVSPKSRIHKSNTMSTATGRTMLGQATANNRRSAYETTKLSTSTDKANAADAVADPRSVHILFFVVVIVIIETTLRGAMCKGCFGGSIFLCTCMAEY